MPTPPNRRQKGEAHPRGADLEDGRELRALSTVHLAAALRRIVNQPFALDQAQRLANTEARLTQKERARSASRKIMSGLNWPSDGWPGRSARTDLGRQACPEQFVSDGGMYRP